MVVMSQHYMTCMRAGCTNDTNFKKGTLPDYKVVTCTECNHRSDVEPTDGESYDKSGNIRPVPPGVPNRPGE